MNTLKLKKGDMVKITTGKDKGKTGKIVAVVPKEFAVKVEGINIVKRHNKPNMVQPQGGITNVHKPIDISKVALVHPTKKDAVTKVGFSIGKDGSKKRVYKVNNKEIA